MSRILPLIVSGKNAGARCTDKSHVLIGRLVSPSFRMSLFGLLCLLLLGSCKDFLTVAPADELSREDTFSSFRGAEAALMGAYFLLGEGPYYRSNMLLYPDMAGNLQPAISLANPGSSDNAVVRTYSEAYSFTVQPEYEGNNLDEFYDHLYRCLYQINDILLNIDQLEDGLEAARNSLKGEALALRALIYFDLVRLYGQAPRFTSDASHPGVVMVTDRLLQFTEQLQRASVGEVYTQIQTDLAEALELIDPNLSRRTTNPFWMTPTAVSALQARVAAYLEDWEALIGFATTAIHGSRGIASAPALTSSQDYLQQWQQDRLSERIFAIDLSRFTSPGSFGLSHRVGNGMPNPVLNVSSDLLGLFEPDDLRRQLYVDNGSQGILCDKYRLDANLIRLPNPVLLRTSELYLLRAEAYAALGRDEEARADYDRIQQRARPSAPSTLLAGPALHAAIRQERRRELALEGHLLFDLSRWGEPVLRNACLEFVLSCSLDYPDHRYVLPIPQAAIFVNPNLVQNEGY